MSYYDQTPLLQSGGAAGANTSPATIYSPTGSGFVQRSVDPNSLVSNQLDSLLAGNSPYIAQARRAAANQSASRGLLNSSIASGAGEAAAISAGLPIASADASTVGATDAANMDAENQFLLNQGQWNNQARIANTNLNASTAMAREAAANDRARLTEQGREYDLTRGDSNAHYDTDWQHQIQGSLLGTALGNISGMDSTLYQTILNDPTMLNDPAGASGLANFWTGQFGDMLGGQLNNPNFLAGFGINIPGMGGTGGTGGNPYDVNNIQPPGGNTSTQTMGVGP